MFEYDSSLPLESVLSPVEEHAKWTLHDLSYRGTQSPDVVQAWLIVPRGSNRYPFVTFLHGGAQDRSAFLGEAALFAESGTASLLIDLPQTRALPDFSHPDKDRAAFVQTVVGIRRGLDYLALRSDIDISRGALVGVSFGGSIGSMVAAADARVRAAVLTATPPRMSEFWRSSSHPEVVNIRRTLLSGEIERYTESAKDLDAIECLRRISHVRFFFQFGTDDELISEQQVQDFSLYVSDGNQFKMYESASHFEMFSNADIRQDRLLWLQNWVERA
ncbi:MAG TPA: alpha/beta fold hydrolase [Acidobacteriaceae bacterium]